MRFDRQAELGYTSDASAAGSLASYLSNTRAKWEWRRASRPAATRESRAPA